MPEQADRWTGERAALVPGRCHGSLDAITDSERRALRPIGTTISDVAVATTTLLTGLLALPGLQIFQGVAVSAGDLPRIPHVISSGSQLVLVESVAWPPGCYAAAADGRIHCDGVYIGQSVRPLMAAVQYWRAILPVDHAVSAMVIVHLAEGGELTLPAAVCGDLAWARARDAAGCIRALLAPGGPAVSAKALAALAAATAEEENR